MDNKIDVSPATVAGMLEGVTPGPWYCTTGRLARVLCLVQKRPVVIAGTHKFGRFGGLTAAGSAEGNARFIAWAREAVPALSERLDAEEKERDQIAQSLHAELGAVADWKARAELAEAALHGPITTLTPDDMANIIAHLSPDLETTDPLPNRNSVMMALIEAQNTHKAALATARTDALEEAARRIEETMKEAIRENGPVKSLTDKAVIEMLEAIVSATRALKDQTPAEVTVQDARIPDHAAWAARGRWREAYEALRALADEGRT